MSHIDPRFGHPGKPYQRRTGHGPHLGFSWCEAHRASRDGEAHIQRRVGGERAGYTLVNWQDWGYTHPAMSDDAHSPTPDAGSPAWLASGLVDAVAGLLCAAPSDATLNLVATLEVPT